MNHENKDKALDFDTNSSIHNKSNLNSVANKGLFILEEIVLNSIETSQEMVIVTNTSESVESNNCIEFLYNKELSTISETKKNADKIEPSENNPRKKKKRILPSIPIETSIENRHSTNIPLKEMERTNLYQSDNMFEWLQKSVLDKPEINNHANKRSSTPSNRQSLHVFEQPKRSLSTTFIRVCIEQPLVEINMSNARSTYNKKENQSQLKEPEELCQGSEFMRSNDSSTAKSALEKTDCTSNKSYNKQKTTENCSKSDEEIVEIFDKSLIEQKKMPKTYSSDLKSQYIDHITEIKKGLGENASPINQERNRSFSCFQPNNSSHPPLITQKEKLNAFQLERTTSVDSTCSKNQPPRQIMDQATPLLEAPSNPEVDQNLYNTQTNTHIEELIVTEFRKRLPSKCELLITDPALLLARSNQNKKDRLMRSHSLATNGSENKHPQGLNLKALKTIYDNNMNSSNMPNETEISPPLLCPSNLQSQSQIPMSKSRNKLEEWRSTSRSKSSTSPSNSHVSNESEETGLSTSRHISRMYSSPTSSCDAFRHIERMNSTPIPQSYPRQNTLDPPKNFLTQSGTGFAPCDNNNNEDALDSSFSSGKKSLDFQLPKKKSSYDERMLLTPETNGDMLRKSSSTSGIEFGPSANLGEIEIQFSHNEEQHQLTIKIIKARNLIAQDSNGFSDPFVKICLLPGREKEQKRRTHHVLKNLNPVWNYCTVYPNIYKEELKYKTLEFTAWDWDRFKSNDFLGLVCIKLDDENLLDDQPRWYKLREQVVNGSRDGTPSPRASVLRKKV